ncbi:hypothetical protein D3C77_402790 [compost metagenome]
MAAAAHLLNPFNPDRLRSRALNAGTHRVQQCSNIYNFRLFRRILNNCGAFGSCSRQHNINRSPNAANIKIYLGPSQLFGFKMNGTVLICYRGSQRLKSFNMLIYRTGFKITTSRQPDRSLAKSPQHGTHHVIRGTQFLHWAVRHRYRSDLTRVNFDLAVCPGHFCSKLLQYFRIHRHIAKMRQIIQSYFRFR